MTDYDGHTERRIQLDLRRRIEEKEESLRDRFAMAALTGLIANNHAESIKTAKDMALFCYGVADEMMDVRKAHHGSNLPTETSG